MRNLIQLLAFCSIIFLSCSDDPCKNVSCGGNGDCIEGFCECNEGFEGANCESCMIGLEGENCSIEVRNKFLGIWETFDFACPDVNPDPDGQRISITVGPNIDQVDIVDQSGFAWRAKVDGRMFTIVSNGSGTSTLDENDILNFKLGFCSGTFNRI